MLEPVLRDFDERVAAQFRRHLQNAEAHGIYVVPVASDELTTPKKRQNLNILQRVLQAIPTSSPGEAVATHGITARTLPGRVTVRGATRGTWCARWMDDVSGESLGETEARSRAGALEFAASGFAKHGAARLDRAR